MKKAIVIGSGIGGLASAIRLKCKGYDVHVYEKNAYPGGKLTSIQKGGYRFDAGPSIFTLPHLVDELFSLAGKDPKDYFQYQKLDISARYFWEDGTKLTAYADRDKLISEIESKLGANGQEVDKYLSEVERLFKLSYPVFVEKPLNKLSSFLNKETLLAIINIRKFNLFTSLHNHNKKRFTNPKLVQMWDRYASYNGSNPYTAPGVLSVISNLENNSGVFLPKGGTHSITQSLHQLGKDIGITYHFNKRIQKIDVNKKTISSITVDDISLTADLFVSNVDVSSLYNMIQGVKKPTKALDIERSSSALVFYWGISKSFDDLGVHNILFSDNYIEEFKHIFELHDIYIDPTIYINITSKEEHADAPTDCENWFIMINAPSNFNQDWEELIPKFREIIKNKINRILNVDIDKYIEVEEILDPISIEEKTSSHRGSIYGAASNSNLAIFRRHPNSTKQFNNLFFVGGSVHPGGGMPICLNSAKIVDRMIKKSND